MLMDAVIFGIIAVIMTMLSIYKPDSETSGPVLDNLVPEDTTRTTKLNESFYEDPNAFSEISSALGFPRHR